MMFSERLRHSFTTKFSMGDKYLKKTTFFPRSTVREFFGVVTDNGLIEAQRFYQRNKEISILVTVGVYILNIVDANVAAHLRQFNVNEDLSFEPEFEFNELTGKTNLGVSLNYRF